MQKEQEVQEKRTGRVDIAIASEKAPSITSNKSAQSQREDCITKLNTNICESISVQSVLPQISDFQQTQQSEEQHHILTSSSSPLLKSLSDIKAREVISVDITNSIPYYLVDSNNNNNKKQEEEEEEEEESLPDSNQSSSNSEKFLQLKSIPKHKSILNSSISSSSSSSGQQSHYNQYPTQYKKYSGVSVPNRIFPVNNLANSSLKLSSQSVHQSQKNSSAKILRLLKKDITSVPSFSESVSTVSSIQNIGSNLNNQDQNAEEEKDDPKKFYESSQVSIDESNQLETKIHSWLEQQDVHITCPSSKMHDYYDNIRQNTYWNIKSIIFSESDLDQYPTPSTQCSQNHLNHTESPLPFTPTPHLERRISGQLTTLLPNCNFLNRRRLTQKIEEKKPNEIEEERDEWDQD